jgi:solute carrier family 25, member 34/35
MKKKTHQQESGKTIRKSIYSGPIDCVVKILKIEGIRGLYKGLAPTMIRLTPHTVMLWIVQEKMLQLLWNHM